MLPQLSTQPVTQLETTSCESRGPPQLPPSLIQLVTGPQSASFLLQSCLRSCLSLSLSLLIALKNNRVSGSRLLVWALSQTLRYDKRTDNCDDSRGARPPDPPGLRRRPWVFWRKTTAAARSAGPQQAGGTVRLETSLGAVLSCRGLLKTTQCFFRLFGNGLARKAWNMFSWNAPVPRRSQNSSHLVREKLVDAGRRYWHYAETINSFAAFRPALRRQLQLAWDLFFSWMALGPHTHDIAMPPHCPCSCPRSACHLRLED